VARPVPLWQTDWLLHPRATQYVCWKQAQWAKEQFGWREIIGSVCIMLADVLEIVLTPRETASRR